MQCVIRVLYGRFMDIKGDDPLKGTSIFYQVLGQDPEPDSFGVAPAKAFIRDQNLIQGVLKGGMGDYVANFRLKSVGGKNELVITEIVGPAGK